ncbi:MAG: TolC family protein, partial [candidate division KSB1 bacterium]|nr:TolC family protein [candidate division KSB1 bacterium]
SGNVIDRKDAESESKTAGVALTWTLFDGFDMFISHARLRELRSIGELQFKSRVEATLEQVTKAYYDVVQQKNRLSSLRDVERLSEERYRIVESQYGIGSASKLDLLNAQVDLNADRSAVLQQEVVLTTVKTQFNQLLSRSPSILFDPADSIDIRPDLTLEQLLEQGREANTELQIARRNSRLANLDLKSIWTERLPVLTANAGYNLTRSQSQSGFINRNETQGLNYGLTLSYPLFDGFNLNRRQQNAQLARSASELQLEKAALQLETDLTRAFQRYQNYLAQVNLERQNVQAAREHMEIAFARYKVGTLTAIEWREAQLKHLSAIDRLISAQYQAKAAETELLRLSGRLLRQK